MLIRRCNLDDRAELLAVRALQRAAYEIEAALIGTREIPGLNETPEQLAASRELFWGCRELGTDRLTGVIALEEVTNDRGQFDHYCISRLAVAPAFFRRGVGRALLHHVLDEYGRRAGCKLRVSTGAANTPGRSLYESEGFHLINEREVGRAHSVRIVEYQWGGG